MEEKWEEIEGFEGMYQVSNLGRVRALYLRNGWGTFSKEHIFTGYDNGHGYIAVHLRKGKKRYVRYVHRLVAAAFCEKNPGCDYVNHLDHNRRNNAWTNLEWCTQTDNVRYSSQLMKKPRGKCKKSNTGEKYITYKRQKYRVSIHSNNNRICDRSFETLDEAVTYRNALLAGTIP